MTALTQSYVFGASKKPLLGETIGQFFDAACGRWADRPALVVRHQKVRMSYGQLKEAVDKLAAGLLRSASSRAIASASGRPTAPNGR